MHSDERPLIARHERSRLVESHFDINMSTPYFMMLITQIARKPSKGRQIWQRLMSQGDMNCNVDHISIFAYLEATSKTSLSMDLMLMPSFPGKRRIVQYPILSKWQQAAAPSVSYSISRNLWVNSKCYYWNLNIIEPRTCLVCLSLLLMCCLYWLVIATNLKIEHQILYQ